MLDTIIVPVVQEEGIEGRVFIMIIIILMMSGIYIANYCFLCSCFFNLVFVYDVLY